MPKKASINSFTGGLALDYNELITTEKVLTDAVNASLITGNGDEFSLQNDMGNVKIPTGEYKEYALLEDGYIPIGVKELNGIAYLVSYNPETKKTLLGTYPGPRDYTLTLNGKFSNDLPSEETIYDIPLTLPDDEYLPRLRYGDKISIKLPTSVYSLVNIRGIRHTDKKAWDLEFIAKINGIYTPIKTEYSVYKNKGGDIEIQFNYTLSTGELALKVTPNKILSTTVGCSLIKKEDFLQVKSLSSANYWMDNIPENNLLVFNISYTHNTNESYINGFKIVLENKVYYIAHNPSTTKKLNEVYVSTLEGYCILDDLLPDLIDYKVFPVTFNVDQTPEEGTIYTKYKGLLLNTWKYNDSELHYGFIDNTLYSSNKTLTLTFVNIITKDRLEYKISNKSSFSGTFTFDNYSDLEKDSIYLCKIQLTNTSPIYRWVFTNGIYNEAYNTIEDFGSDTITQYNDIEATFDPFAGEEPQSLVKDTVNNISPFISTTDSNYGALTINQTHLIKVLNSGVFSLDDNLFSISNSPTLPKSIAFKVGTKTSEVPVNSINNTFTNIGNAITWVKNNSSKLDSLYISTENGSIDFMYTNRSAAIGTIKKLNTVTADNYFRPFMIDPADISRDTRLALRSNMLAFGNEIRKDYLPMEYLMLLVLRNGDENTLQRYLINRESVDCTINSSNGDYIIPEQVSDDDDARCTDLNSTATLITENSEELVQEGISVVDEYVSSINKVTEIDGFTEDTDYTMLKVNTDSSLYDKLIYSKDSVDLTSKNSFDDFKLIPFYFLNAHNWSTNRFLPTLFFIGSYNLIDGLHYNDGELEDNKIDTYDSWDGYMCDNNGNILPFDGGNNPRADSGWQCREGYNAKYKYSRYNTLIPLWMNDDGTYTTLNYLVHYLNNIEKYKNVTKASVDGTSIETYGKGYKVIKSVIKNLIALFKNYYLYTNLRIEVPDCTLYVINPEDTTYTTQYTNDIIYNDVTVLLSDSDLWVGDIQYNDLIERGLKEFPELTDIQKDSLRTLSKMKLVGYNPSITFTQRQKSYSEYLNNYISGNIIHYPICYTGKNWYITTVEGKELDKNKCYVLGDNGLSEVVENPFTLVNIDAPIGNYSTLLLNKENLVKVPTSKKPPFAPSLYKHNGMFLTTKNLPINLTIWNNKDIRALLMFGEDRIRYDLPDNEQNYFYNETNGDWNDLNDTTK